MLHEAAHEHGSTFDGFKEHIAGKAVADDHIHSAQGNVSGLHVAHKIQDTLFGCGLQHPIGFFLQRCSLGILGTDVQQTHLGVFDT